MRKGIRRLGAAALLSVLTIAVAPAHAQSVADDALCAPLLAAFSDAGRLVVTEDYVAELGAYETARGERSEGGFGVAGLFAEPETAKDYALTALRARTFADDGYWNARSEIEMLLIMSEQAPLEAILAAAERCLTPLFPPGAVTEESYQRAIIYRHVDAPTGFWLVSLAQPGVPEDRIYRCALSAQEDASALRFLWRDVRRNAPELLWSEAARAHALGVEAGVMIRLESLDEPAF